MVHVAILVIGAHAAKTTFVVLDWQRREIGRHEGEIHDDHVEMVIENMARWSNNRYYALWMEKEDEESLRVSNFLRPKVGKVDHAVWMLHDMEMIVKLHLPAPER